MRVGVVFPQLEIGNDPDTIATFAREVEALGYTHLVAYDHVLGAQRDRPGGWTGVYDETSAFHEPFVLFAYIAAVTTWLELAPAVIVLPQRQTALVAKQAAALDVLSRGRLRLGVAIGWNAVEYEALGEDFASRARRIGEQIALMRRLWTEEVVSFSGRWHTVARAGLNPLPVQRPIPVWMGGAAEPAMKRIARLADGWFTFAQPTDAGRAQIARMKEYLRAAGRDPDAFPIEGRVNTLKGGPEDWAATAAGFRAMALSHLEVNLMGAGRSPAEHLDVLRRFRETAPVFD